MKTKIIRGCWQLAADHSPREKTIKPILDAIACGFTTFDCGDIYTGVEELLGKANTPLRIHTKFVPDRNRLHDIDRSYIEEIIDRSRRRLQMDRIDLVQFHWWDWEKKNYLFAMEVLAELQAKGKIGAIGLTNMNSTYLEEHVKRFPVASMQLQASLFDKRVDRGIGALCRKYNISIYAYGTLLGGFLNEKWLGKEEPTLEKLENRSLVKYKLLLDAACGWNTFQQRLQYLGKLACRYHCEIGSIAVAALLQRRRIDAAIVGLSPCNYSSQNRQLALLPEIAPEHLQEMERWTCHLVGDVYDEERDLGKPHTKVMKYNLNAEEKEEYKG